MYTLRYLLPILLLIALGVGCKKKPVDPAANPGNLNSTAQTDPTSWTVGALNSTYTIKFPANYTGEGGRIQIDGWLFSKERADKRASFGYAFCTARGCAEYGPMLLGGKTAPAITTFGGQALTKTFTVGSSTEPLGYFYFSEQTNAVGVLYLLTDLGYRESLNVSFDNAIQAEVLAIIGTIRAKG
jgi:hypothetical protein